MKISKQGQSIRSQLLFSLKALDQQYQTSPTVDRAIERLSLARTLHLLFNDSSQILYSQLLVSEQYLLLSSYDLSETYALEILDKDQSFSHRLRADIVLLKIKSETDSGENVIGGIEKLRRKYQQTEGWTSEIKFDVVKIEAKTYKKIDEYDKSINIIKSEIEDLKKKGRHNSKQHAHLLLENADSYFCKQDYLKAAAEQKEAISIYEIYYRKNQQQLVKMYLNLSKYQQKMQATQQQFKSLKKAQQIHKIRNCQIDKILIDIKKRMCQNLQKRQKLKEAMKEFQILKDLINQKYGSFSMEIADTKKKLGRIYQKLDKKSQAMLEYSQAANIYSENKEKNHMEECRSAMYRIKPHRLQIYKSIPSI